MDYIYTVKYNHRLTRCTTVTVLNLHRDKKSKREPGRDGNISTDHRQDGNVAVDGIGYLAR